MSDKPYGPWTRCKKCGLTMADWHDPDENGIRWAVKLTKKGMGKDEHLICLRCK